MDWRKSPALVNVCFWNMSGSSRCPTGVSVMRTKADVADLFEFVVLLSSLSVALHVLHRI